MSRSSFFFSFFFSGLVSYKVQGKEGKVKDTTSCIGTSGNRHWAWIEMVDGIGNSCVERTKRTDGWAWLRSSWMFDRWLHMTLASGMPCVALGCITFFLCLLVLRMIPFGVLLC